MSKIQNNPDTAAITTRHKLVFPTTQTGELRLPQDLGCFLFVAGMNHDKSMCGEVGARNVARAMSSECCNIIIISIRVMCLNTYWGEKSNYFVLHYIQHC